MTVNRKQESNPRAVLRNPLKLYNDLVGDRWLHEVCLTAQSSSRWIRLLLVCSLGSQSPVTAAATLVSQNHTRASFQLPATVQRSAVLPPSVSQNYQMM